MTRWLRALGIAGLTASAGCSFALNGPSPDRPRDRAPTCDTSKGLVAVDATVATLLGVTALGLISNDESAAALLPLSVGALYAGGAVAGNSTVDECRQAIAEFDTDYERDHQAVLDEPRRVRMPVATPARRVETPAVVTAAPAAAPAAAATVPAPAEKAPAEKAPVEKAPAATPDREDDGGDWSAFWKEVP